MNASVSSTRGNRGTAARLLALGLLGGFVWMFAPYLVATAQESQAGETWLKNGRLEAWSSADQPVDWILPPTLRTEGYQLERDSEQAFEGDWSARLDSTSVETDGNTFGNLMQSLDAEPLRGKRIRFRAGVRTDELDGSGRAQLWLRVDRATTAGGTAVGAFDNMDDRPIRDGEWKHYEIVAQIDDDAQRIYVGLLLLGKGKAWLDDVSLEAVDSDTATTGANIFVRNRTPDQTDPQQPFFVPWLLLVPVALVLFALAYTNCGVLQRFGLRFSLVYWLLYCLPSPFNSLIPWFGYSWGLKYSQVEDRIVRWTAQRLLGIQETLVAPNGSGDTTFAYIQVLICFVVALLAAVVWSAADRRRTEHPWIKDLLRSYLRYVLAFTMLGYGLAKVGTEFNQFPPPDVDQLMKTYGESSPMNLVWTFMGAS
jgi:hypothetical protein